MTWSDFYLFCFVFGFTLSLLSFLAGAFHLHLPFKMHLHLGHHGGHAGGGLRGSMVRGGAVRGGGAAKGGARAGGHISWFNASTAMAFLAWFGGTGYILATRSHLVAAASLGFSTLAGLVAGWVVFKFMVKLMRGGDSELRDEDYRVEGSVGSISVPIREQGTGEVIFSLAGVRRGTGARSEDGKSIEKGAEVVIERYEKGIAYVRRWDEFTKLER
jgi:membrane protein implicated in regulation of membrane protease activity